ncbi:PSD1 and planctomycete cytochrome C domain-containing protein [Roseimaritima ulvae]|uniref:Planctomycete cytochrome C n=1 Tax=Roseimaritima ulvae TaxID=980254 RepID=A0A5B9R951_9BACT|nr:PSD1 and planctomycete cytochrome C domain-containing protein [Roseimaritima ulvae]QEG43293.1 Planctomycete cytochrome C [Roseimaritima ulvae]
MHRWLPSAVLWILLIGILLLQAPRACVAAEDAVDRLQFNRDIRPLLSDRCFLCHGPDQSGPQAEQTELRLDDRDSALEYGAIDLQDVEASEILARVTSDDPELLMPPAASHKKRLTDAEVDVLRRWIAEGAQYQRHWAYLPPKRPAVPRADHRDQVFNPIDAFVQRRLASTALSPAPPANRQALIRRVSYDLTGLPPTVAEIDAFVSDPAPLDQAYKKVVERLLRSPHYGEHMSRAWLDAARYADTSGYQYDKEREQWVWRDWVIHAFNSNMPFDQFTIQQIAGDLLPDANDQTRLATGFNRNHPITIEGGVVDEEYRTEYVIDRVVTTSTVWMGQTFLCARCHDHKYDPISQQDFYQFYSFFNNVPERGLNGFNPKATLPSPLAAQRSETWKRQLQPLEARLARLRLPLEKWEQRLRKEQPSWRAAEFESVQSSGGATPKTLDDQSILMTGTKPATDDYVLEMTLAAPLRAVQLEALVDPSLTNGSASRGSNGNFVLTEFVVESAADGKADFQPVKIVSASADYEQSGYTIDQAIDGKLGKKGWAVDGNTKPENRTAVFNLADTLAAKTKVRIRMQHRWGASHQIGRFRLSFSQQAVSSDEAATLLATPPQKRTPAQRQQLTQLLVQKYGRPDVQSLLSQIQQLTAAINETEKVPATMIMQEMAKPRQAYVLERGEYDKPRKDQPVQPAVPEAIGTLAENLPPNRLGLAQWLVSPEQPLTSRVTVNRFWQKLFGVGLVKTSEDFGSQGEFPSHPELLDWLAVEFMESGWDVKHILKTIVMSNTYRQSSRLTPQALSDDPQNRLLARGPRVRLEGEMIRDSALAVSGLLDTTLGGPSVYPYHPDGLWLEINNRPGYSRAYPHQSEPVQHHRRSMYTFWKRTVAPPSMATFDAPDREYCVVRRSRTNTPLQAFVMLHDPQFVEAARHLAARMIEEGGATPQQRIEYGFMLCTSRSPADAEQAILQQTLEDRLTQYQKDTEAAERLLNVGVTAVDQPLDPVQLAAYTQVARMLMNLSEFLTKG